MSEEKIHSPRQQRLQVNSLITSCCLHLWAESGAGDKPAGRQTISEQNVTRQWSSWALITLRHKLNNENTLHVLFCCFIMFGEKSACVLFLSLTVGFLFYDTVFMIIVSFCNKRRKTCQIQLKLEHKEVKNVIRQTASRWVWSLFRRQSAAPVNWFSVVLKENRRRSSL